MMMMMNKKDENIRQGSAQIAQGMTQKELMRVLHTACADFDINICAA